MQSPPNVCLQVNTSGEASKHGWSHRADPGRFRIDRGVPVDSDRGPDDDGGPGGHQENARASFAMLRETRDALRQKTGLALPELSMGMSGDFEPAILEGATLVRIGTAIFEGLAAVIAVAPHRLERSCRCSPTLVPGATRFWASGPAHSASR